MYKVINLRIRQRIPKTKHKLNKVNKIKIMSKMPLNSRQPTKVAVFSTKIKTVLMLQSKKNQ